ncbi:hypothetical protein F5Y10DRAFT_242515 [Nemania abortiva]|nr:hypothetical protein F5Y10DRAFT_242515 [Nemania abortiva]
MATPLPLSGSASPNHSTAGSSSSSAATATSNFTPEMRDRQARGKDPYSTDSEDDDLGPAQGSASASGSGSGSGKGGDDGGESSSSSPGDGEFQRTGERKANENFAVYDRRRTAAQILDSPELLMMAAMRDDLTIPAIRFKYTRVLCGLDEESNPIPTTTRATPSRPSSADERGKRSKQDTVSWKSGGSGD